MTSLLVERSCSLLVTAERPESVQAIKEALEGGDPAAKAAAMKNVISQLLNGEAMPQIFITIVRYVLPAEDHTVQKLLLLYLEIIEKTGHDGKTLPEMILICQNLRNNLQSPNEYLRGVTLRFLCRLRETEILEPLVPSILANLEHRHSFVRRHAVLAVDALCKLPGGETLLPDAPDTVDKFLHAESDLSARRNAFLMLCNHAQERALAFLLANVDQVTSWGDILQTVALDLIRKVRTPEAMLTGHLAPCTRPHALDSTPRAQPGQLPRAVSYWGSRRGDAPAPRTAV
jgi:coatomer subunit beta